MADPTSGTAPRCQWCSAPLPAADLETCPSCGATLSSAPDTGEIRGVTTLDTEAILRSRSDASRPRSRLLSFITGEEPVELGGPEEAESLAPPDDAVRREMLRLQFEAERADLEAESIANKTDVVLDEGIDLATLGQRRARPRTSPMSRRPRRQVAQGTSPVASRPTLPPRQRPPHPPARRLRPRAPATRHRPRCAPAAADRLRRQPPVSSGSCPTACPIPVPRTCASRRSASATAGSEPGWPSPSTGPTTGGSPSCG